MRGTKALSICVPARDVHACLCGALSTRPTDDNNPCGRSSGGRRATRTASCCAARASADERRNASATRPPRRPPSCATSRPPSAAATTTGRCYPAHRHRHQHRRCDAPQPPAVPAAREGGRRPARALPSRGRRGRRPRCRCRRPQRTARAGAHPAPPARQETRLASPRQRPAPPPNRCRLVGRGIGSHSRSQPVLTAAPAARVAATSTQGTSGVPIAQPMPARREIRRLERKLTRGVKGLRPEPRQRASSRRRWVQILPRDPTEVETGMRG